MDAKMDISAIAAMERLYGFLVTSNTGSTLLPEWRVARSGLATMADYEQVVQRLASAAARLCDPISDEDKRSAKAEVVSCIRRLQEAMVDP